MNTVPARRPELVLIAALARGRVIGRGNALPWHLPEDLAHFRRVTMGAPVLMGRRTWDSLPARFRPLPGRTNIVLTRDPDWQPGVAGVPVAHDITAALALATALQPCPPRVFVIGGAMLYAQSLALADELCLTEIDAAIEGDVHFPAWAAAEWTEVARERHQAAAPNDFAFSHVSYRRRPR